MPFDLPELIRNEIAEQQKLLAHGETLDKRLSAKFTATLKPDRAEIEAKQKAAELESKGWETWLLTLFPFAFEEDFSADHRRFWDLHWSVLMRIREQKKYVLLGHPIPGKFKIEDKEYVVLLILGRGLAKSSTLEASAVMRAALLRNGYCLYISEAQDQAEEHLGNCKILIESEDSRAKEFYPHLTIDENAVVGGKKTSNRSDLFMTKSGYIFRAKGLNSRLRGLRVGVYRPDDIKLDDIDGVNDSIAVSVKKLKQITASVIPTQARRWATLHFGQNLVAENGVITQIHTGKSDAFAERTTIGVSNTFENFREGIEYRTYFDEEDGRIKHKILEAAIATWAGVEIAQAQKFLNDSGLETFLAEYQNSFAHLKTGKVFHEFDEKRHIIPRSLFAAKFGYNQPPAHWRAKATADLGFTKESISAWTFYAAAAQNSALPSRYFCYRAMSFIFDSIDDQAVKIWEQLFPDPEKGKRHFEAEQRFTDYPELFRLLSLNPKTAAPLKNYRYNASTNKYELKKVEAMRLGSRLVDSATDEEKALFYVHQAQKTFKSQITSWVISHEKSGEQKTLAQKYGIPVNKTKDFKADSGVSEANHLLRGDYTRPHPFFDDEMLLDDDGNETGKYKLGEPYLFFIVDDEQLHKPFDDLGMKTLREHLLTQVWTEEKLTERGLTTTIPMKYKSDFGDALRMFAANYQMPASEPLTREEEFTRTVEEISPDAVAVPGEIITPERQMQIQATNEIARQRLEEKYGEEYFEDEDDYYEEIVW